MDDGKLPRRNLAGRNKPSSPRRVEAADKRRKAIELRKAGANFEAIAQEVGYANRGAAYKAVMAGLEQAMREPAEAVRKLELERLDRLFLAVWPSALKGDLKALDRCLQIIRHRASILGLFVDKLALTDPTGQKEYSGNLITNIEQYSAAFVMAAEQKIKDAAEETLTEKDLAAAGFLPAITEESPCPRQ